MAREHRTRGVQVVGVEDEIVVVDRERAFGVQVQVRPAPRRRRAGRGGGRAVYGKPIEACFQPGDGSHPHASAVPAVAEVIGEGVVRMLGSGSGEGSSSRARE